MNAFPNVKLTNVAAEFATTVHPLMTRAQGGCMACHDTASKRQWQLTADPVSSFYVARSSGYLEDHPASILARLVSTDALAAMPRGAAKWTKAEVEAVVRIQCQLKAYAAQGNPAADEEFPPGLLLPFTKPAGYVAPYDNSFINFPQLKGKVKQVFNDTWVRGTAPAKDNFAENIGLFGGVNFTTSFVEARVATPEFLLGLDKLAPDICTLAATNKTGPFTGLDPTLPIVDVPASSTRTYEAESAAVIKVPATGAGSLQPAAAPTQYLFYTNGTLNQTITLPSAGTYEVVVRARADNDDGGNGPKIEVKVGSLSGGILTYTDDVNFVEQKVTVTITAGGPQAFSVGYINDSNNPPLAGGDRNVIIDRFQVIGPLGAGTGTTRTTAAKSLINTLYQKMLYRPANTAEQDSTYTLVSDLSALGTQTEAWAGVCEALVRHPDFLFTVSPTVDTLPAGAARTQLLVVKLALDLLGRPPTAAEIASLGTGKTFSDMVDTYLSSTEFRDYYFFRMQLRTESQGEVVTDEPARTWAWIAFNGAPFRELLSGDYTIDAAWMKKTRPVEHGKTGLLTMKGFISNKPGLPHYNYAARVMTDFMGKVFEVPPEVFDQRGTATAASTVDKTSLCFSCHNNLTPLSHQRLKWDDDGKFRTVDAEGKAIDDTDRGLVENYAFKGAGMEGFATNAVKKESFNRRIINAQARLLLGREMRVETDERTLYKNLWDVSNTSNGNLKAILKAIALSSNYQRTP